MIRSIIWVLLLLAMPALCEENVVVIASVETGGSKEAATRIERMFELAQKLVTQYETMNGQKLAKKISKDWQEQIDQSRSYNLVMDAMLVKTLCDIKDKRKDKKEISVDSVYAACLLFLKYEDPNMMLPSCLIAIFKEKPDSVKTIKDTIEDSIKKLNEPAIASTDKKEEKGP